VESLQQHVVDEESLRDTYQRAKVSHFLDRAGEYLAMGRCTAARKMIEHISALDPGNPLGKRLRKELDELLADVSHPDGPGVPAGNGNGNGQRKRRSELVMVVDQDERVLMSLLQTLHRYGFRAVTAGSYEEAIETLSTFRPDLIVSEVNFESGPRGFDLFFWLKNHLDIPFLFLAARLDRETLIAGKRFGVDDFLPKPLDSEVVLASVMNCLSRRRLSISKH
jgi:CheY-like chemotaxis protein